MKKYLIEKLKALRQLFVSGSCEHSWCRTGIRYGNDVYKCHRCGKYKDNYR